jgi:hypothetical protein
LKVRNMNITTNSDLTVASTKSCLLYDGDGAIRVVHEEVTMEGGRESTSEAFQRATREIARKYGVEVDGLEMLVHDGQLDPEASYRVNVADRSLVQS